MEVVVIGLSVCTLQQLYVKRLGRLHQSVVAARRRFGRFAFQMANCFNYRDDGDDGLLLASSLVAVADDLNGGEWAHTVVHTYNPLSIVGNQCQSVLYRVVARLATIS